LELSLALQDGFHGQADGEIDDGRAFIPVSRIPRGEQCNGSIICQNAQAGIQPGILFFLRTIESLDFQRPRRQFAEETMKLAGRNQAMDPAIESGHEKQGNRQAPRMSNQEDGRAAPFHLWQAEHPKPGEKESESQPERCPHQTIPDWNIVGPSVDLNL
jgi:hypothetical protein